MGSNLAKLANYKQVAGIAVAALILTVIFVPFQTAQAYTVDLTLPSVSTSAVPTSAAGTSFQTTITVAAGELIRIDSIEMILDSGTSAVKRETFNSSGARTAGDGSLVKGSLTISIPSTATQQYGYGYGYGLVSSGSTFSSPYTYAFSYSNAFISGNTGGYTYAVSGANNIFGVIGPATVTITGKLNTALMTTGSHVLEMLIRTGSGGNNVDQIVAPPLVFTTTANTALTTTTVSSGTNVQTTTTVSEVGTISITFGNVGAGGTIVIEKPSTSTLSSTFTNIFTNTANATPQFTVGSGTFAAIGNILDIDISTISFTGSITITVPYDPSKIPGGTSESDLKLLHFNTSTNTWSDVTTSRDTVANTITGTLTSLSPVAVGIQVSTTTTTTTGTSSAGGGGTAVDLTPTHPDSYFVTFPLKKIQVQAANVIDAQGNAVNAIKVGQQVSISSSFKNFQERSQTFAYIVQVVDANGFTVDLGWQIGTLSSGQTTQVSRSLTVAESGTYAIKIFVWNDVSATPVPLSEVTARTLSVT